MGKRGCKKLNWHELCEGPFEFNRQGAIRAMKLCCSLGKKRHQEIERDGEQKKGNGPGMKNLRSRSPKVSDHLERVLKAPSRRETQKVYESFVQMRIFTYHLKGRGIVPAKTQ